MTNDYFFTPYGQYNYQRVRQSTARLLSIAGAFTAQSVVKNSMVKAEIVHSALDTLVANGELVSTNHPEYDDDSRRIFTAKEN